MQFFEENEQKAVRGIYSFYLRVSTIKGYGNFRLIFQIWTSKDGIIC
jgi:hypothetical protein